MSQAIKIIIVCAAAHFAAYFVLSRLTEFDKQLKRYFVTSVAIISIAVILHNILIAYMATALICLAHNQRAEPSTKIAYFFGLAFSISFFGGVVVKPGIELGAISHPRILVLTLLLPIILFVRPNPGMARFNAIDKTVFCFFVWIILLNIRAPTFTGMMRQNLWVVLDYIVPYIVIRRYLSNYALVLAGIAFALISQATLGIAEAILRWHVHTDVELLSGFESPVNPQYKFRGPFLRVQASFMNPLIFALFANMAFLCAVIYFAKIGIKPAKRYTKFYAWMAIAMTVLGTVSSGSRAGIAGSVIIVVISMVLLWAIKRKKDPKKTIIAGGLISLTGFFALGGDFIREHFEYRVRLAEVSYEVIKTQPLFGSTTVRDDPRMQVLHLGEGIIDIVNTYLEFALSYGVPAMLLFIMAILLCLSKLYDSLRYTSDDKLAFGIFAFASLFILAFNLATSSAIGWTYPWIWICIAIGSNIVARVKADWREQQKNSQDGLL